MLRDEEIQAMLDEPVTCPQCSGTGKVTATEESKRRFLESIWQWDQLRQRPNADLARMVSEVENYLRYRDLAPVVFNFLQEVWWRLNAADEPIEATSEKIEALSNDPKWLESD